MELIKPAENWSDITEPVRFSIPAELVDADALAGELAQLARATEWKRAALIYARVRVGKHGGSRGKIKSGLASASAYAALGINGLRSPTTVRAYWRAWQDAIDDGMAQTVFLGAEIRLPVADWSDYYPPRDRTPPELPEIPEPPETPADEGQYVHAEVGAADDDFSDDDQPQEMSEVTRNFISNTVESVKKVSTLALEWVNEHLTLDDGPERAEMLEIIEMADAALNALKRAITGEQISDADLYRFTE